MATTVFDPLSVRLSRKIFDPVAAAGTDGSEVTSALRTDYINRATRFIQDFVFTRLPKAASRYLSGTVDTQSFTFAGAGTAVDSTYLWPLYCLYTTPSPDVIMRYVDPEYKAELDIAANPNDTAAFTVVGGNIYGYYNGSQLSSGSGSLVYVKKNEVVQNTGPDLLLDGFWHSALVDIAASFHFEEKGELSMAQAQLQRVSAIMQSLR